jgi:hypothetical protein
MDLTSFLSSVAAKLTADLIAVSAKKVQKLFSDGPRQQALNQAMGKAFHAMASGLSDDPDETKHYIGIFSEWMKRDLVAEELAQVIDPRPDSPIDMKLLRSEFEAQGYAPDGLGKGVDFETCIVRFVEAFCSAAELEPELQDQIKLRYLAELASNTRQLVDDSKRQSDSLKRIEARIAPDLSGLQRNYLQRIVEQCRFLPLKGIDFKSSDATCDMDERIGLSDIYIQLDTTEKAAQSPKGRRAKSGITGQDTRWHLSEKKWRKFELSPLSPEKINAFISAWYRQAVTKNSATGRAMV